MTYKPVDSAIVMVVGPCIDDTDFKTLEEAITYNAAGMDVSLIVEKTDGTTAVTAITLTTGGTSDWTHKDGGYYEIEITAAQNAEEGIAYVRGVCTGVLPFESIHYNVVKANVYDSWIKGTDVLQTDVTQWRGTDAAHPTVAGVPEVDVTHMAGGYQTVTDLKDFADVGYNPVDHKIQEVVLVDTTTTNTDMVGTDNAALASVCTESRLAELDAANIPTDIANVKAETALIVADTNELQTDWADGGRLDLIIDACALEATVAALNNISTTQVNTEVDTALADINLDHLVPTASTVSDVAATSTDFDTALTETTNDHYNNMIISFASGVLTGQSRIISDYDGTAKNIVISPAFTEAPGNGDAFIIIPLFSEVMVGTDNAALAATALTNVTWTDAKAAFIDHSIGTVDTVVDGIQTDLDNATDGLGALKALIDTIDGIVDNILVDTAVIGALGAGLTAVPWNSTWDAEVQSECADALTAYDPPTRTEATADKDAVISQVNANETKIDALQTDSTAIKAKTDSLPSGIAKNVALSMFDFLMVLDSDHTTGATGKTITGQISKEGGAFAGITNTITEVGSGMYVIASGFTQAEMNADVITLKFTATDCDARIITIHTS